MSRIRTTLASIFVLGAAVTFGASQVQAAPVGGTAQLAVATGAGLDTNVTKVQYYGGYGYGYGYGYPRPYYPPRYYYPPPRYYYPPAYYYPPRYRSPCFGIYGGGVGFNFC
jgi:hypothetical protein